jgi:hypothetical protein
MTAMASTPALNSAPNAIVVLARLLPCHEYQSECAPDSTIGQDSKGAGSVKYQTSKTHTARLRSDTNLG